MPCLIAAGTTLTIGPATGVTGFTEAIMAGVTAINIDGITVDIIDCTDLLSGAFKQKVASWADAGTVSFDINLVQASAAFLTILLQKKCDVEIRWQDDSNFQFVGIMTNFSIVHDKEDVIRASVTFTTTGAFVFNLT